MNVELHVGVEVYQLIVTGVHVFTDADAAYDWYEEYTGLEHPCRRLITEDTSDEAAQEFLDEHYDELDEDFDQTKLFVTEVDIEQYEMVCAGCGSIEPGKLYECPDCKEENSKKRG